MNVPAPACPQCQHALPVTVLNTGALTGCPACATPVVAEVFPAWFRRIHPGQGAETILVEGEAGCFYHPAKRAVVPCGACGRFLCALCDVDLNDQHLCPACLESGRQKGKLTQLETKRTLYDSLALSVALIPLILAFFLWPFTFVSAPLAVFLAIFSWYRPRSLVPRTRIRAYLAILLGGLQIAGWVLLFVGLALGWFDS